jgi:anti-anti-sigma factor
MSDQPLAFLCCPMVVLRVTQAEILGDTAADGLREELLAVYRQAGAVHAVLDLEKVVYLSSAGIRPLLALNKAVRAREGRLILCRLTTDVEGVLVTTRLVSTTKSIPATFEMQPDIPAAVASLYHNAPQGS